MACSSNCMTGPHESWGACIRAKNLKSAVSIPGTGYDRAAQHKWDQRLDSYRSARAEGIQPKSTKSADIQAAVAVSEKTGSAFTA